MAHASRTTEIYGEFKVHNMSLTKSLREAAISRAFERGDVIDSCVIAPDGVIDLRIPDLPDSERADDPSGTVLSETLGGFRAEIDVDNLYKDDHKSRWQRILRIG